MSSNPLIPPGFVRAIIAIYLIGETIYAYLTNPCKVSDGLIESDEIKLIINSLMLMRDRDA